MTNLGFVAALAILASPASVAGSQELAGAQGATVEETDTTAAAIVVDCSARKFETSVEIEKDGQKRRTRLKLCAAKDADDAAWAKTLEDAKAKIASHPDISEESKAKIAAELDAEIARIEKGDKASTTLTSSGPLPVAQAPGHAAYPPPPSAPAVAQNPSLASTAPARAPAKPRLTIRCLEVGESGDGQRCISLERDTQLAIRADDDLAGGVSLRFLRRGDVRGEVALAAMRQGQVIRSKLPRQLCAGVASSKVEIQIIGSNQVVDTLGPYLLRC